MVVLFRIPRGKRQQVASLDTSAKTEGERQCSFVSGDLHEVADYSGSQHFLSTFFAKEATIISLSGRQPLDFTTFRQLWSCYCTTKQVGLGAGQMQQAEFFGPDCSLLHCPTGDDPGETWKYVTPRTACFCLRT